MSSTPPAENCHIFSARSNKIAISEVVTGVGLYVDLRDWLRVQSMFASTVITDYTSLFQGAEQKSSNAALVRQWQTMLPGFDATQHLITNLAITGSGDTATVLSHVRATHWIETRLWTIGGTYTHHLIRSADGWKITYMKIDRRYEEGNRTVLKEATERVSAANAK
jgi:ketosteroid isomerase-like protein